MRRTIRNREAATAELNICGGSLPPITRTFRNSFVKVDWSFRLRGFVKKPLKRKAAMWVMAAYKVAESLAEGGGPNVGVLICEPGLRLR